MLDIPMIRLRKGGHSNPKIGVCLMEAVAYVMGEKHSDKPSCVCPVIGEFGRRLNDWMTQDERDEYLLTLLLPIPICAGTNGTIANMRTRAFMCADTAVRVFAPIGLEAAGGKDEAAKLRGLPPIIDAASAASATWAASATSAASATRAAWASRAASASSATWAASAARAASAASAASARKTLIIESVELFKRLCEVGRETQPIIRRPVCELAKVCG